ncbi:uncharacterized protein rnf180a [Labrus mixtus]|uniref:uncharacterized protein rnf180a n=1 Tax=Labrus mixtus TaxID=508554 RepID=UPI0029C0ABCB|nr:uncharacterized protein rnf180a [Labrus mixtus]
MSSQVGSSGASGSSRIGRPGSEDADEGYSNIETNSRHLRGIKPADLAGEGRSRSVDQLVRPALPGRKAHRKTCSKDSRGGRQREGNHDREEEHQNVGRVEEKGKQRQRKVEKPEKHADADQDGEGRESTESLSSSSSDVQVNSTVEVGEGSNSFMRLGPRNTNLNPQSPWLAVRSSALSQPHSQTRSTPPTPQRFTSRTATELPRNSSSSSREPDPFWVDVRTGAAARRFRQSHPTRTPNPSVTSSEIGEEEEEVDDGEEGGSGVMEVTSQAVTSVAVPACVPFGERRKNKREKNRMKCLRRRQRRRERWRQSQLQENRQSSTGNASSSSSEDDEDVSVGDREGYICAVCLDVYLSPYMCHPCNHIFCEPCLRTLAKNSPTNTPCPLCRTIITHVFFQKELNQTARTFFPKEYLSRKQNFQKASCAKWPLPSCRKLFRIFGGFQRPSSPIARRQFPHGGGYRLDALDFEDDSRGWRFDMDMVIIYIYSVNWVIGFFIFCFLCYLFFPSF